MPNRRRRLTRKERKLLASEENHKEEVDKGAKISSDLGKAEKDALAVADILSFLRKESYAERLWTRTQLLDEVVELRLRHEDPSPFLRLQVLSAEKLRKEQGFTHAAFEAAIEKGIAGNPFASPGGGPPEDQAGRIGFFEAEKQAAKFVRKQRRRRRRTKIGEEEFVAERKAEKQFWSATPALKALSKTFDETGFMSFKELLKAQAESKEVQGEADPTEDKTGEVKVDTSDEEEGARSILHRSWSSSSDSSTDSFSSRSATGRVEINKEREEEEEEEEKEEKRSWKNEKGNLKKEFRLDSPAETPGSQVSYPRVKVTSQSKFSPNTKLSSDNPQSWIFSEVIIPPAPVSSTCAPLPIMANYVNTLDDPLALERPEEKEEAGDDSGAEEIARAKRGSSAKTSASNEDSSSEDSDSDSEDDSTQMATSDNSVQEVTVEIETGEETSAKTADELVEEATEVLAAKVAKEAGVSTSEELKEADASSSNEEKISSVSKVNKMSTVSMEDKASSISKEDKVVSDSTVDKISTVSKEDKASSGLTVDKISIVSKENKSSSKQSKAPSGSKASKERSVFGSKQTSVSNSKKEKEHSSSEPAKAVDSVGKNAKGQKTEKKEAAKKTANSKGRSKPGTSSKSKSLGSKAAEQGDGLSKVAESAELKKCNSSKKEKRKSDDSNKEKLPRIPKLSKSELPEVIPAPMDMVYEAKLNTDEEVKSFVANMEATLEADQAGNGLSKAKRAFYADFVEQAVGPRISKLGFDKATGVPDDMAEPKFDLTAKDVDPAGHDRIYEKILLNVYDKQLMFEPRSRYLKKAHELGLTYVQYKHFESYKIHKAMGLLMDPNDFLCQANVRMWQQRKQKSVVETVEKIHNEVDAASKLKESKVRPEQNMEEPPEPQKMATPKKEDQLPVNTDRVQEGPASPLQLPVPGELSESFKLWQMGIKQAAEQLVKEELSKRNRRDRKDDRREHGSSPSTSGASRRRSPSTSSGRSSSASLRDHKRKREDDERQGMDKKKKRLEKKVDAIMHPISQKDLGLKHPDNKEISKVKQGVRALAVLPTGSMDEGAKPYTDIMKAQHLEPKMFSIMVERAHFMAAAMVETPCDYLLALDKHALPYLMDARAVPKEQAHNIREVQNAFHYIAMNPNCYLVPKEQKVVVRCQFKDCKKFENVMLEPNVTKLLAEYKRVSGVIRDHSKEEHPGFKWLSYNFKNCKVFRYD